MSTIWLLLLSSIASGNSIADYYRRTQALATQSFQRWQRISASKIVDFNSRGPLRIKYSGGSKARAAAREQAVNTYLEDIIPATTPSDEVAHIPDEYPVPVDASDSTKRWTAYYEKAKNGLRPHVEYDFKSNGHAKKVGAVTLSEEHIENLEDNFDVLMWYRNELDSKALDSNHIGDRRFRLFLDYFVADLLKSLPLAPRISLATGSVDAPEWELDERKIREQLIMAYRYLVAKYQIYPEYEEFGPADRELLITMMKISLLMGADINPTWFQDKDINLKSVGEESKWKKPIADALKVLKAKSEESNMPVEERLESPTRYEEPCVISIPPPKPRQSAKPTPPPKAEDTQKIEIILKSKS